MILFLCMLALVAMNVIWAGSYAVMKVGSVSMSPLVIAYLRLVVSLLFLAVFTLITRPTFKGLSKGGTLRIISSGFLLAASQLLQIQGVKMSFASDASLLFVFEPITGILLAAIILKERMLKSYWLAMFLAVAGLFSLSGFGSISQQFGSLGIGNLLIVLGVTCECLFSIIIKPVASQVSSILITIIVLFVAVVLLTVPMFGDFSQLTKLDLRGMFVIGYLAIPCTVIGYTAWVKIMRKVPVNLMYFSLFVQPTCGPIIAYLFLNEKLDERIFVGGILLLLGMFTAVFGFIHAHKRRDTLASIESAPI